MPSAIPPIDDLATYSKKYVTPAQLAAYVGITRRTIYHHIDKGALRVVHIGGVIRIRIRDARTYAGEPVRTPSHPRQISSASV